MPVPADRPPFALIVEDSMIIALEIETLLQDVGIDGSLLVRQLDEALSVLETRPIGCAIIDADMGRESVNAIILALRDTAVPFILSARYAETDALKARFPDAPILAKPFRAADLYRALERIGVLDRPETGVSK